MIGRIKNTYLRRVVTVAAFIPLTVLRVAAYAMTGLAESFESASRCWKGYP